VYKLRYEIDNGYDESIGFSEAKIDKVEQLCIGQGFLAEEEYPQPLISVERTMRGISFIFIY